MGLLAKLASLFGGKKNKVKILVVGLDNSGKSTIIQKLKPQEKKRTTVPTVGFNMDEFDKGGLRFSVFDMSGANKYRSLWEKYYKDAQAAVFVVDTADKIRMCVVKDELDRMLAHGDLAKIPILFFANKKDLANAMTPVETAKYLDLEGIQNHPWQIVHSNGLTGEGLSTGIDWLAQSLS